MRFPISRIAQIVVMLAAGALALTAAIRIHAQNASPGGGQTPASADPLPQQPVPQPITQNVQQPPAAQQPATPGQSPAPSAGQTSAPQSSSQTQNPPHETGKRFAAAPRK